MYYRFSNYEISCIASDISQGLEGLACADARNSISSALREFLTVPNFRKKIFSRKLKYPERQKSILKALLLLERIRLSYSAAGCWKQPSQLQYATLLVQWVLLYWKNTAEKIAKYLSCNIFSYVMHQDPVEPIELPFGWVRYAMGPGPWRTFIKTVRNRPESRSKLESAQNFLYLKKGAPVVSDEFKIESLKKHKKALSVERKVPEFVEVFHEDGTLEVFPIKVLMRERIHKVIHEVFKNVKYPSTFWEPSSNASRYSCRSEGGQAAHVEWELDDDQEFFWNSGSLLQMPAIKLVGPLERKLDCEAVPICEPFKVRVITKGPANSGYLLKGLQMALWKKMKEHPVFCLTGRTVNEDDIPVLLEGEKWLSGDFSAATDNLAAWCSRRTALELSRQLDLPEELIVDSLCHNQVSYGEYEFESEELSPFDQKNGQLMGSVLSFIVLNIVNACLMDIVLDPENIMPLRRKRFRVNGDDSVSSCTEQQKTRWYALSDSLGLVPSVGKTYYSDKFAIINSTCFFGGAYVPYLNGECLQPFQGKGGEKRGGLELSSVQQTFLSGFTDGKRKAMNRLFIQEHWETLVKCDCNWFLPKCCGGLGLESIKTVSVSQGDRMRAFLSLSGKDFIKRKVHRKVGLSELVISRETEKRRKSSILYPGYMWRFGRITQKGKPKKKVLRADRDWYDKLQKKVEGGISSIYLQAIDGEVAATDYRTRYDNPFKRCWKSLLPSKWAELLWGILPKDILKKYLLDFESLTLPDYGHVYRNSLRKHLASMGFSVSEWLEVSGIWESIDRLILSDLSNFRLEDEDTDMVVRPSIRGFQENFLSPKSKYEKLLWTLSRNRV